MSQRGVSWPAVVSPAAVRVKKSPRRPSFSGSTHTRPHAAHGTRGAAYGVHEKTPGFGIHLTIDVAAT
jgi:hypothetical protein